MNTTDHIIDITEDNFNSGVMEASYTTPVLVDFWASWCGPCKALMPIVTKLAQQYQGQFILAKVNIDEQQQLAAQFAVRSVPTVKLVKQGQVVDEFMGALPEGEIRAFLDKHIECESDRQLQAALEVYRQGDAALAIAQLQTAIQTDPDNPRLPVQLVKLMIEERRFADAEELIKTLPMDIRTSEDIKGIESRLTFLNQATAGPSLDELKLRIVDDPKDCAARHQLASLYISLTEYEAALEQLLEIIRIDRKFQDDIGRKDMLKVFDILGDKHELVTTYRQKMSRLLF